MNKIDALVTCKAQIASRVINASEAVLSAIDSAIKDLVQSKSALVKRMNP